MKIIHTADIHLDSKLNSNFDKKKAKERKIELLQTFQNLIIYATNNGVKAILISGDLFDTKTVAATERHTVEKLIKDYANIEFFYLRGNHDDNNFLANLEDMPKNLKLFNSKWISYNLGEGIIITGVELDSKNKNEVYSSLNLNPEMCNIVMMHGQENEYREKDKTEVIAISELRNKNIDYLALGHVHSYKKEKLDSRGTWCYSGCLEGRGFDECGECGFVLVEIDENNNIKSDFVPFAYRKLFEVEVDISGANNSYEIVKLIEEKLKCGNYSKNDLLKIILIGYVEIDSERNIDYIKKNIENDYYFVKIKDKAKLKIDYNSFAKDESLKGEFVRTVMSQNDIDEEQKARIIKMGIDMLKGEKV